jgi:hypothetical protein
MRALVLSLLGLLACSGQPVAADVPSPDCPPQIEIEGGRINTNYTDGVGYTPGRGTDPHEEPLIRFENGVLEPLTDASRLQFPNGLTDARTGDCGSRGVLRAARMATRLYGEASGIRILRPDEGVLSRLERGGARVQFIVNQPFGADGHNLLVTWALPPNWDPRERYVIYLFIPGFGHTNNSKVFSSEDGPNEYLPAYFAALEAASSDRIIFMHINGGGRTSLLNHAGHEQVLIEALRWGQAHLGAQPDRLVLNGQSRGGNGVLVLSGRLAALPDIWVRGVFASGFAAYSTELTTAFEIAPAWPDFYGDSDDTFPHWRDLYFNRHIGADDALWRGSGVRDIARVRALGPLGGAETFVRHARADRPTHFHLVGGAGDRSMLPSSPVQAYNIVREGRGVTARLELYIDGQHISGNVRRNRLASEFAAAIADGRAPDPPTGVGIFRHLETPWCYSAERVPVLVRYPVVTAPSRPSDLDVVGPAGQAFRVEIVANERVVLALDGRLSDLGAAQLRYTTPPVGQYTIRLVVDNAEVDSGEYRVNARLPASYRELRQWRADIVPSLHEPIGADIGCAA